MGHMRSIILTFIVAFAALAQGPRIIIVTDIEGVGGVNSGTSRHARQRRFDESHGCWRPR